MANERLNTDENRGAYFHQLLQFYKDLGFRYVNIFNSKDDLINYIRNLNIGEKKKFALGYYYYDGLIKKGHMVAVKSGKSKNKEYFRTIDFQREEKDPKKMVISDLPSEAIPPFHLFEKISYYYNP